MNHDLEREMREHIEERAAELMRDGLSAEDARDRARREFGNLPLLAERSRDVWRWPPIDEFWRATAHAARALRRGGAYTLVSLITLALGIGVNTAIFGILDAALFHALPYHDPARLVRAGFPMLGSPAVAVDPEFISWRNENHSFAGLVAFNGTEYTLIGSGEPERITARTVSADFLAVLGIAPSLGRDLVPGDDRAGAPPVALISDALWHRRWNGDPSVVGRPILLDKDSVTVVGVLPANFLLPGDADVLVPAKFGDRPDWAAKGFGILTVIGRLKPGVTPEAAATDLQRVSEAHQRDRPVFLANAEKEKRVTTFSLEQSLMSDVRPALLLLIAAVGVVLLIACANVAALQLSRFNGRVRELGIRAALGASRAQLVRLVFAESLLLSLAGAAAGCAGAYFLIRIARPFYKLLHLANPQMIRINAEVAMYSLALTVLCAILFAIGPAALVGRTDTQNALRSDNTRGASGLRNGFRGLLITTEMALAIVLLLGAGLLLRSFAHLIAVKPGFETRGILIASMNLQPTPSPNGDPRNAAFVRELMTRLASAPGLIAAGAASSAPFGAYNLGSTIYFEGRPAPAFLAGQGVPVIAMTPGFFRTIGMPILSGRNLSDADSADRPRVAVVNVAFAQQNFQDEDPIGRRFNDGPPTANTRWITIVGIVADSRHEDLSKAPVPEIFVPFDQLPIRRVTVTMRTAVPPESLASFLREQVRAIAPNQPIYDVSTMENRIDRTLRDRRLETVLLGSFAALALLLAAAGVYGVMSYSVSQSRREIGIRMALGATPAGVTGEVLRRALRLSLVGLVAGLIAAWYLTRFLASFLYGVGAKDPMIFSLAPLALLTIALLASYLPARRAAQVDPVEALRTE